MAGWTKRNIDWGEVKGLSIPHRHLELTGVALGLVHLRPGKGYTFTHAHEKQEEVYMVIEGRGHILLDGEMVDVGPGDFVRVSPQTRRAVCAAADSYLKLICAGGVPPATPAGDGSRVLIDDGLPDFDDIPPWCRDDPTVAERNAEIRKRMGR